MLNITVSLRDFHEHHVFTMRTLENKSAYILVAIIQIAQVYQIHDSWLKGSVMVGLCRSGYQSRGCHYPAGRLRCVKKVRRVHMLRLKSIGRRVESS